ncbi:MAG: hypothetical protein IT460_11730 [Planctomycetes bacterium]|nr:hypothetical protein [Planctomycetota bacterium]
MGRFLSFLLGGLALALYVPHLFLTDAKLIEYRNWWVQLVGQGWYDKVFAFGPGIFAGLALMLFAVRGRDHGGFPG